MTVKTIVSVVIILLFLIWIFFKIPSVQNWLAQQATDYLSSELNTKVLVDKVEIQLFKRAVFKNFYVEDLNRDTLIHASDLTAHFDISKILKGKLVIKGIDLDKGYFQYNRLEGQKNFNLQFLISYFQPKKKPTKKGKFELDIRKINLTDSKFCMKDEIAGSKIYVFAPKAYLHAKNTNIIANFAACDSVYFEDAIVKINVFRGCPLVKNPEDSLKNKFIQPNWKVSAGLCRFVNLDFHLENEIIGKKPELPIDFADLHLQKTDMVVENINLEDFVVHADFKEFRTKEARGFEILSFRGQAMSGSKGSWLRNFELQTEGSTIGNDLEFTYEKYPDFIDFVHKVRIAANITNARITLRDVMAFAAPLNKIPFFQANMDREIYMDAYFNGTVDSFQIQDIVMNFDNSHVEGQMSMKPFEKYIEFDIHEILTNFTDLKSVLSFTKIPEEISRMGKLYFNGKFDGYLNKSFLTKGKLMTDIGDAAVDFVMSPQNSVDSFKYDGNINLGNFNLGVLLKNPDLGRISAYVDLKGKGLTLESMRDTVRTGRIDYFEYKGYRYDTVMIDGLFSQKKFNGKIKSFDQNFNLNLQYSIDLNPVRPVFQIYGQIKKINFCELRLLTDDLIIAIDSVDVRLRGYKIDDFSGRARFKKINFHRGWGDYKIDSIFVGTRDTVFVPGDTVRFIRLRSDIASGTLIGHYDLVNMPLAIRDFAEEYYPNFIQNLDLATNSAQRITIKDSSKTIPFQDLHLELTLNDTKKLSEIINKDFKYVKGGKIKFDFDNKMDTFLISAKVDSLKWAGFIIKQEEFRANGNKNNFKIKNSLTHLQLNDSTMLPTPYIELNGKGDSVTFKVDLKEIGEIASNINLNGNIRFGKNKIDASLNNSGLVVLNQRWNVNGDNNVSFDFLNNSLNVKNLLLQDSVGVQKIELKSYRDKGLTLGINRFNLKRLYEPVKLPMFDIDGILNASVTIEDLFKQENLRAKILLDELVINKDNWNKSSIDITARSFKDTIKGNFLHQGPIIDELKSDFFFIPAAASADSSFKNYLHVNFNTKGAKAKILEYFMVGQLNNTVGTVAAEGKIFGKLPKLNIEGIGKIDKLSSTFNFLNTRYSIEAATLILNNNEFAFSPALETDEKTNEVISGIIIEDQEGNKGYMGGRILHNRLKDWGIDMDLIFNRNLTLNTDESSNMPFYGKVYASGKAKISGLFTNLTMDITAETNYGPKNEQSLLVLPIMKPVEVNQAMDYVVFKNMKQTIQADSTLTKPKNTVGGIEVKMNITATPAATARIIIDEKAGDVIEGRGSGKIQLDYTREGELKLNGDYTIEQGNYLFTYRNIINKPFTVQKGGTIRWSGDPYNADVNLKAKYVQKSRLYNLLVSYQEELQNTETRDAANKPVDVEVIMNMTGSLMRPDIKFGLNISGDVGGKVATLSNMAMRAIQQDESKLNRQVFGLIALNQFLPEENAAANINLGASSFNTLSEMVSQQFSRYLGDLLSEVVEKSDFISSVDVQIGYKLEDDQLSNTGTGSQFDMSFDNYLFNDKLRIHIGANVDFNNANAVGTNQNYIGGDFIIEYAITQSGNLKVRAYNRSESSLFGPRIRTGGGFSYQLDFDSFNDMVNEIKTNSKLAAEKKHARREARRKEELQ